MKSLLWLQQMSSGAQNGEVESSLSKSLSKNPPAAVYFHIHIRRLAFVFLFFTSWWDWSALWKKHQTSIFQSPQFLGACREYSQTRIYHTFWWFGRSERCFIRTEQTEEQPDWGAPWVTPLACEPFVNMIIPIPLNKTWAGTDLSGGTPLSGPHSCHLAPWALSSSGSSSAWGFPQIIPCHPHLIPLSPHISSLFSLLLSHYQLLVFFIFLLPEAVFLLGRSRSFAGGWSSSQPWSLNCERSPRHFWSGKFATPKHVLQGSVWPRTVPAKQVGRWDPVQRDQSLVLPCYVVSKQMNHLCLILVTSMKVNCMSWKYSTKSGPCK